MGEPPGPGGWPGRELIEIELGHRRDVEAGRSIADREILEMSVVQRRHAQTVRLTKVAPGDAQDDGEARARLTQIADAGERRRDGTSYGGEQAAPGEYDRDLVGDTRELGGERFEARPDEDHVGEPLTDGSSGIPAETSGVGVDADEQPVRGLPAERIGEPSVSGAEVEGHPAAEAGQSRSESVVRALEPFAANNVHAMTPATVSHERNRGVHRRRPRRCRRRNAAALTLF